MSSQAKEWLSRLGSYHIAIREDAQQWFACQDPAAMAEYLAAALENREFGSVARSQILHLLGYFAQAVSFSVVAETLDQALIMNDFMVIRSAIQSLQAINTEEAAHKLIQLLTHSDEDVVKQVVIALGVMKNESAIEPLFSILSQNSEFVRFTIVDALLGYDKKSVNERLHQHYTVETAPEVRDLIKNAGILSPIS